MNKSGLIWLYEGAIAVLAITAIWLLAQPEDAAWAHQATMAIWMLFVVDYLARLVLAQDRRRFVLENLPDLIAILPLDYLRIARAWRLVRLIRLLRSAAILWRVSRDVRGILAQNGLGYVLVFATVVVLLCGGLVWVVEPGIDRLGDAIWWSVVTATTVGYGDIVPKTPLGRIAAVLLMVVGIGTIGMITGSVATYFVSNKPIRVNRHVAYLREQLGRWDELTPEERRQLAAMVAALADGSEPAATRTGVPSKGV